MNPAGLTLRPLKIFRGRKGPLLLVIMDGIGIGSKDDTNAVFAAKTPTLDWLCQSKLFTQLQAHGTAVGLPSDGDMGNSEVGHNALGAGRVIEQGARLVNKAISTGSLFGTKLWSSIVDRAKQGGTIHFIGLLSDGNVHSHIDHLYALVDQCAEGGLKRIRLHVLLDGRDVGERSALTYVVPTEDRLNRISKEKGFDYKIASGGGRMHVTMDRYNADWRIVQRGWECHVMGKGRAFPTASQAIRALYKEDATITDQYLDSFVIVDSGGKPVGPIQDGDAVIFFNFRGDRAIEISKAFTEEDFNEFQRGPLPDILYAGMMEYDGDAHIPPRFLVGAPLIERTMSEYLCAAGMKMFAISETQKFGHVTYFWNGNRSGYVDESLEAYIEIPSDKIQFDKAPRMKALEIRDRALELIKEGGYHFGRLNFANGDMVGHTGSFEATVEAVETVDQCIAALLEVIKEVDGIAVVTSDHGNADVMFSKSKDGTKVIRTAHTLNRVPFAVFDPKYQEEYEMAQVDQPGLSNVAATLLNLLGYEAPHDYDPSLIRFKTN